MHFFDSKKEIQALLEERILGIEKELTQIDEKKQVEKLNHEKDLISWLSLPKYEEFLRLCEDAKSKLAGMNQGGNLYSQFDRYIKECKVMFTVYHPDLLLNPYVGKGFFLPALTRLRTTYQYLHEHPPLVTEENADNFDEIEIYSLSFFQTFKNILEILEKFPNSFKLKYPELIKEITHFRNFFAHSLSKRICRNIDVLARVDISGPDVGVRYYSLKLFDRNTGKHLGYLHYSIDYFFLIAMYILSEFCHQKLYDPEY